MEENLTPIYKRPGFFKEIRQFPWPLQISVIVHGVYFLLYVFGFLLKSIFAPEIFTIIFFLFGIMYSQFIIVEICERNYVNWRLNYIFSLICLLFFLGSTIPLIVLYFMHISWSSIYVIRYDELSIITFIFLFMIFYTGLDFLLSFFVNRALFFEQECPKCSSKQVNAQLQPRESVCVSCGHGWREKTPQEKLMEEIDGATDYNNSTVSK